MIKGIFKIIKRVTRTIFLSCSYLYKGMRQGQGKLHLKQLQNLYLSKGYELTSIVRRLLLEDAEYEERRNQRLHKLTLGLHALLPRHKLYHYSLILVIDRPLAFHLKTTLRDILRQTAPKMEVIIGFRGSQQQEIYDLVEDFKAKSSGRLHTFQFEMTPSSLIKNHLVEKSQGNYLVFVDQEAHLRPDLIYHYEQALYLFNDLENCVLYCSEYTIDPLGQKTPLNDYTKPKQLFFPYFFVNYPFGCFMLPRHLWEQVKGFRVNYENAHLYDLFLRLDLAKAKFQKLPFYMYGRDSSVQAAMDKEMIKEESLYTAKESLKEYATQKGLQWEIAEGLMPGTLRAIPTLAHQANVHVIIPFKDQKKLTLAAIKSIFSQGWNVKITAVDNRSSDTSIGKEISAMGCEVLFIDEPFNFSRLNNLAVKQTKIGQDCELILFLNNDVELKEGALEELCRWIDQPQIGMVGARLNFPNGALQCGGVDLNPYGIDRFFNGFIDKLNWAMTDKHQSEDNLKLNGVLRVADAISGAATLIKKKIFLEVGGFDEIWYPISYSDTNLAIKLKDRGLWSFYTPYAVGIHYESVSRDISFIDDFEVSTWLNQQIKTTTAEKL